MNCPEKAMKISHLNPNHCDPHLNQTFNDLLPLTIHDVLDTIDTSATSNTANSSDAVKCFLF